MQSQHPGASSRVWEQSDKHTQSQYSGISSGEGGGEEQGNESQSRHSGTSSRAWEQGEACCSLQVENSED